MNPPTESPVSHLFATEAVKVAQPESPYFLTSGLLSMYYINAEHLCGGREKAAGVLTTIDAVLQNNPNEIASRLLPELRQIYADSTIFKNIIDHLAQLARDQNPDFISGGERRDWVFAPLVAQMLAIPCIYITKSGKTIDDQGEVAKLSGSALHIADLLTIGASYTGLWIPTMNQVGAPINSAINVVDRQQGGVANLQNGGIRHIQSIYQIDAALFDEALVGGHLNEDQSNLAKAYLANPDETMRNFLLNNPDFLKKALLSMDPKIATRAQKLVEQNLYQLPPEFMAQFEK